MLPIDWHGDSDKQAHLEWMRDIWLELGETDQGKETQQYLSDHNVPVLLVDHDVNITGNVFMRVMDADSRNYLCLNPNRIIASHPNYNVHKNLVINLYYAGSLIHELKGHHEHKHDLWINDPENHRKGFSQWLGQMILFEAEADFEKFIDWFDRYCQQSNMYRLSNSVFEHMLEKLDKTVDELIECLTETAIHNDEHKQAAHTIEVLQNRTMPEFKQLLWPIYYSIFMDENINTDLIDWRQSYAAQYQANNNPSSAIEAALCEDPKGKIYAGQELVAYFTNPALGIDSVQQKSTNPPLQVAKDTKARPTSASAIKKSHAPNI
ncbi:MAG: hypothetical protein ACOYK8_08275 [Alphaproteobacteria bacterium]